MLRSRHCAHHADSTAIIPNHHTKQVAWQGAAFPTILRCMIWRWLAETSRKSGLWLELAVTSTMTYASASWFTGGRAARLQ